MSEAASFFAQANDLLGNYFQGLALQNAGEKEKAEEIFSKLASSNKIGIQTAIVKPFAKSRLVELNR